MQCQRGCDEFACDPAGTTPRYPCPARCSCSGLWHMACFARPSEPDIPTVSRLQKRSDSRIEARNRHPTRRDGEEDSRRSSNPSRHSRLVYTRGGTSAPCFRSRRPRRLKRPNPRGGAAGKCWVFIPAGLCALGCSQSSMIGGLTLISRGCDGGFWETGPTS